MDPADADRRIAAQGGLAAAAQPRATHVLVTDGDPAAAEAAAESAFREALARAGRL
jgi:hypothetical protein